jgi:Na+/H+-dicarboxylate symporter/ABC-type amino acid transport substrate-binding protein
MHSYTTVPKHISLYLCIGILLGALCGIIFREKVDILIPIESTLNMFVQTLIVLYIPLGLMNGISRLHAKEASRLLFKSLFFILFFWGVIILSCLLATLFLPPSSPSLIELNSATLKIYEKILEYLIPENPFYDALNNILPPLALFSLLLGLAYLRSKEKEPFLDLMEVGNHLLEVMLMWVAYLAPFFAFIHTAVIVGELDFVIWKPLAFYIVTMIAICLFLSLFFLPTIVALLTPLRFSSLFRMFAFIGLATFATGQALIVVPFIMEVLRKIRLKYHFPLRDFRAAFLMIIPLSFSFAQIGNMLSIFFVFFFGYFFHIYFTSIEKFILPIFSIFLSVSSPTTSLEYLNVLAQQFHLPEEIGSFIPKLHNYIHNFKTLLNSAGILSVILIVMMLHEHKLKKIGKKAILFLCFSAVLLVSVYFGIHRIFPVKESYRELIAPRSLHGSLENLPVMRVLPDLSTLSASPPAIGTILKKVLASGKLTVGFDPSNAPYSYLDSDGGADGFDIAYMAQLAFDLDVELELVPIHFATLEQDLNEGRFDIAVGGIMMDFSRILRISFTDFYQEGQNTMIVLRKNVSKYKKLGEIEKQEGLKIGARGIFVQMAKKRFPLAEIIPNTMWTELIAKEVDLLLEAKTTSVIWSLKHPEIVGLDFGDLLGKEYICYALPLKDRAWKRFINQWLSLYKLSGFYDKQYKYWFLEESF